LETQALGGGGGGDTQEPRRRGKGRRRADPRGGRSRFDVPKVGRFNPENASELTKRLKEDEGLRREILELVEEDPTTFVASAFDLTDRQFAHLQRSFSRDDAEGLAEAYLEVLESGGEVDLKIERPKDRVSYREV
jgi:hypothetical protein